MENEKETGALNWVDPWASVKLHTEAVLHTLHMEYELPYYVHVQCYTWTRRIMLGRNLWHVGARTPSPLFLLAFDF